MTNQERQEKIRELLSQIEPLNGKRIFLSTSCFFAREKFNKTFSDTDRHEVEKLQSEISDIVQQLNPLFQELRKVQARYYVEYEGEFINIHTGPAKEIYREEFFFTIDCNIDTFKNGWNLSQPNVSELVAEVAEFLLEHCFSDFTILNIKRLP